MADCRPSMSYLSDWRSRSTARATTRQSTPGRRAGSPQGAARGCRTRSPAAPGGSRSAAPSAGRCGRPTRSQRPRPAAAGAAGSAASPTRSAHRHSTPGPAASRATRSRRERQRQEDDPGRRRRRDRHRPPLAPHGEPEQADARRHLGEHGNAQVPGKRNPATRAAASSRVMLPPRISGNAGGARAQQHRADEIEGRQIGSRPTPPRKSLPRRSAQRCDQLEERRRVEVRVVGADPRRHVGLEKAAVQ